MMLITLQGPQASGKTLMHEKLRELLPEIEQKTGHKIQIRETSGELPKEGIDMKTPSFEVMRFKASGKWIDTVNVSVPLGKRMQDVSDQLMVSCHKPKGGSMVVVRALSDAAEEFFYPIEVKDESSSNR